MTRSRSSHEAPAANRTHRNVCNNRSHIRRSLWLDGSEYPLADTQEVAMNGPYGQDGEFVLVVGGCFVLFLIVASIIEYYMEAKKDSG